MPQKYRDAGLPIIQEHTRYTKRLEKVIEIFMAFIMA